MNENDCQNFRNSKELQNEKNLSVRVIDDEFEDFFDFKTLRIQNERNNSAKSESNKSISSMPNHQSTKR